jgi:hypothetical protein
LENCVYSSFAATLFPIAIEGKSVALEVTLLFDISFSAILFIGHWSAIMAAALCCCKFLI